MESLPHFSTFFGGKIGGGFCWFFEKSDFQGDRKEKISQNLWKSNFFADFTICYMGLFVSNIFNDILNDPFIVRIGLDQIFYLL